MFYLCLFQLQYPSFNLPEPPALYSISLLMIQHLVINTCIMRATSIFCLVIFTWKILAGAYTKAAFPEQVVIGIWIILSFCFSAPCIKRWTNTRFWTMHRASKQTDIEKWLTPVSDGVFSMSRIQCKWGKSFVLVLVLEQEQMRFLICIDFGS